MRTPYVPRCFYAAVRIAFDAVLGLIALGLPLRGTAWAQAVGAEFQVNTVTVDEQHVPAVAADADGNFVAVWSSYPDGSGTGIFGRRYTSAGAAVGGEFRVNTYTTSVQGYPAVAADADGDFVVVWESYRPGSNLDVFAQRYTSAGAAAGGEFQVNTYTTNRQYQAAVAADADGDFVVAWHSDAGQDGSARGVFGQRYTSAGVAVGAEFQVNTYTTSSQIDPAVATDPDGDFAVVWGSYGQDGSEFGVFGRRYTSAGVAVGAEFQVNTYTSNRQAYPVVATDADGDFVVVWHSYGQDGSDVGVFGQRYTSAGAAVGAEFQVNTYTTYRQNAPAVAVDADGDFVVVWTTNPQDETSSGVVGQWYTSSGATVGGEFQVNTYTSNAQYQAVVAADADGNIVVVWESFGQDGSYSGIFGRRFQRAEGATQSVGAGGALTTDTESDGATASDPVETTVISPAAGTISILEQTANGSPPSGFQFVGQEVAITAPGATAADPLVIIFELDASAIRSGEDQTSIQLLRNGVAVPPCTGAPGDADLDPCVSSRVLQGDGDVEITVLTSTASDWTFAVQSPLSIPTLSSFGRFILTGWLLLALGRALRRELTTG